MPVKATVIPSPASLRYSRNSCSEGWLRSCLENQLAKGVWASEECHSSRERSGKHFYFCVFLQENLSLFCTIKIPCNLSKKKKKRIRPNWVLWMSFLAKKVLTKPKLEQVHRVIGTHHDFPHRFQFCFYFP